MFVFGVDIPLIEIVIGILIVVFLLLMEAVVIVALLIRQMNKSKELAVLVENLSNSLLTIKKAEIEQMDRLRKK